MSAMLAADIPGRLLTPLHQALSSCPQACLVAMLGLEMMRGCREVQSACYDMIKGWSTEEHQALRRQVPKDALQTPFRSTTVQVGLGSCVCLSVPVCLSDLA